MMNGRKLWRIPQQGKVRGVCAGIAEYLDIPVRLLRVIVVLSLFLGLFMFTIVAYFILGFVLDEKPVDATSERAPSARELLDELETTLQSDERKVREVERYVTSETFSVRSRFRQI
ncbi:MULTISPECIES: envelope stress response membrane protein PspC [Pantoea]|jgi:phage shock protein C|uniref:Envelope stress response membrane protein PspC n=2 Tax=Pantoea TaxID=53335 RepID=A0AAU7TQZ6_9GAMM|nr:MULTISPECIES: envelope stress response membrane protein PspC [Pantoea]MBD9642948.1 envelope stress response membrane protein PspC [Pantoea sp. PNT02]MBY4836929.1 envelope stress response membrane protein PspC [Pantoea sp. DY-5]NWA59293.1 envelope stress response membrane protein PspC [Pantoea sp. B9002]PLR19610.1 envelope stress response membrane protein PspC [Pantoea endophytica]QCP59729.1 envelope stress response membrane protein PspC [Pantoea sp. SO10]